MVGTDPPGGVLYAMQLRDALANIHRDPEWWKKVLLGGLGYVSLIGAPWTAGLITESIENCRKGFPSPLPPTVDWSGRYMIGIFALLIDMLYVGFPLIFGGCGFFLFALGATVQGGTPSLLTMLVPYAAGLFVLVIFALGVSAIGRLIYVEQARPEASLSNAPLKLAAEPSVRGVYGRARLHSLPAYLPVILLCLPLVATFLGWIALPWPILLLCGWLTCSALTYAHLVVAQLYAAADLTARPFARR